jgi:4-amino-4-deoxy-L-arabinose transferase-like glycosyltransferase
MVGEQSGGRTRDEILPALFAALIGVLVLVLRPPIPLDEIRYLEVLRENERGMWWLLTLDGAPYADKPPLLFWLARLLGWLGIPGVIALRLVPPLCAAGTVWLASRLGRRLELGLTGWLLAAMALPLLYSEWLLFDHLLAFCVWGAIVAWSAGKDGRATLIAAGAFLGKGPVAALFLVPLAWACAPLRPRREGMRARYLVMLVLAFLPLVAWALAAGITGGESFQRELWWDKWMGRVSNSFAHKQPWYFYLPFLVFGALPATPLLFFPVGAAGERTRVTRRIGQVALLVVVVFMLMSGKQPHYLLPLAPAAALYAAAVIEERAKARTLLVRTLWIVPACLLVLTTYASFHLDMLLGRYGPYLESIENSGLLAAAISIAFAGSLAAVLVPVLARPALRVRLTTMMLAWLGLSAAFHLVVGRIVIPQGLAKALREESATPLAVYSNTQAGLYNWLTKRDPLDNPRDPASAEKWMLAHPGALFVCEDKNLPKLGDVPLSPLVHDLVRGTPSTLYRVTAPEVPGRKP